MRYPLIRNNISKADLAKVINFLKKNPILTQNKNVKKFEKAWSEWLGVKYSVFVNSGSSANLISIACLKQLGFKGEIIVPSLTWVSDIVSVKLFGFKPIFVDVNLENLCMNIEQVKKKISKKTVAIFITHAQGFNGVTQELLDICKKKKIYLIEDVCEAHGAKYKKKKCGSLGFISNFSFYYAHHISTIEGGMVCTNNKEIYELGRMFRSHGLNREISDEKIKKNNIKKNKNLNSEFIFNIPGFNLRNNEIGAVLGLNQLKRLDKDIKKRNSNLIYFLKKLNNNKFFINFNLNGISNYALPLILNKPSYPMRDKLEKILAKRKIEFRRGNAGGGNQLLQPYLKIKYKKNSFKSVDHIHSFGYYIGNYPDLKKKDLDFILKAVNEI